MKKLWKEFKAFISRGSVLDLAVGVVIGGAFSAIITAVVNKILMPIVNMVLSYATNGAELCTVLPHSILWEDATAEQQAATTMTTVNGVDYFRVFYINWSSVIEAVLNFFFIALTLFIILKVVNSAISKRNALKAKVEAEAYKKWAEAHPEEAKAKEEAEAKAKAEAEAQAAIKPATTDDVVKLLAEIKETLAEKKAE